MTEWKEYKLGDLIETNAKSIGKGYPYSKILYLDTGSLTCNKIESLQECEIGEAPSRAKRMVRKEDIIYSSVRPDQLHYGFIKNPQDNLVVSTGFVTITCNKAILYPKFLYYYLIQSQITEYLHSVAEASTTAYPSLRPSDIEALDIEIPPIYEQKRIAGVLSSLDDKIDLLNRENTTLEALAETLFRHYFIENPNSTWEKGKLGELINIGSGKALKHSDFINEGLYPVLGANGEIGRANEYLVNETDRVLYTGRVGTLGKIFRLEGERAWLSDNTLVIKPKCHFNYVYFLLKQANLQDLDVGSTQPLIRQSDVVDMDVIIPNDSIIDAFENEVCPLFEKNKFNQQQIQTLAIQRDTLLPHLMYGEVKVNNKLHINTLV